MAPKRSPPSAAEATVDSVSGAIQLLWDWLGCDSDEETEEEPDETIETEGEDA